MPTSRNIEPGKAKFIKRVSCRKLFGRFNYEMNFDTRLAVNPNFIYGDNGTGKTTILSIIYSILSPNAAEGNRTFIANVPFENFAILFDDNSQVVIDRESKLLGNFTVAFLDKKKNAQVFSIKAEPRPGVRPNLIVTNSAETENLHRFLRKQNFSLLYISHDREIRTTDSRIYSEQSQQIDPEGFDETDIEFINRTIIHERVQRGPISLIRLTKTVSDEIRTNLLERANFAQENINSIYLTIAKGIAEARTVKDLSTRQRLTEIQKNLKEIEQRYPSYERIKALSAIPFSEFRSLLNISAEGRRSAIIEILGPFVDGTLARIDNIRPIVESVDLLLAEINSYFLDKRVSYDVISGFSIADASGRPMEWDWLSSGEKQLMFIFFASLLMKQTSALILIDEPELSLNMKWQRRIVTSLTKIIGTANLQFVFATHAFEILAKFQERVQKLENKTPATKSR